MIAVSDPLHKTDYLCDDDFNIIESIRYPNGADYQLHIRLDDLVLEYGYTRNTALTGYAGHEHRLFSSNAYTTKLEPICT